MTRTRRFPTSSELAEAQFQQVELQQQRGDYFTPERLALIRLITLAFKAQNFLSPHGEAVLHFGLAINGSRQHRAALVVLCAWFIDQEDS